MDIQAKINGGDQKTLQILREKGVEARFAGNSIIVALPGGIIPEALKEMKYKLQILDEEAGEGMSNTGHAHIVCGQHGEPLPAFWSTTWGQAGGPHARFAVCHPFATVDCRLDRNGAKLTISSHQVVVEAGVARVKTETLWQGEYDEYVPYELEWFDDAAHAARRKAGNYHCREAMYVAAR